MAKLIDKVAVFYEYPSGRPVDFTQEIANLKAEKIVSVQPCCCSSGGRGEAMFFLTVHYITMEV